MPHACSIGKAANDPAQVAGAYNGLDIEDGIYYFDQIVSRLRTREPPRNSDGTCGTT
jgi:hypothetical protein